MNKIYTPEDYLLLLAYNENSNKKLYNITGKTRTKKELLNKDKPIPEAKKNLDNSYQEPSEYIINNIMNYSKALNVFKLKPDINNCFVIVN